MEIKLQNGENLNLEVSPLLLEYIEDYKGGLKQLLEDTKGKIDQNGYTKTMYATNQLLYAMIASNYDTPLTRRQAVKLVKIEDVKKIIDYTYDKIKNIDGLETLESNHRI